MIQTYEDSLFMSIFVIGSRRKRHIYHYGKQYSSERTYIRKCKGVKRAGNLLFHAGTGTRERQFLPLGPYEDYQLSLSVPLHPAQKESPESRTGNVWIPVSLQRESTEQQHDYRYQKKRLKIGRSIAKASAGALPLRYFGRYGLSVRHYLSAARHTRRIPASTGRKPQTRCLWKS